MMQPSRYPLLFSPLSLNGLVLPNRIVVPAMVTRLPPDRTIALDGKVVVEA